MHGPARIVWANNLTPSSLHREFGLAVGEPLGPAVRHGGGVYTRAYSSCDVSVNCSGVGRGNCKGTVTMKQLLH
jgi:hypothetical protein